MGRSSLRFLLSAAFTLAVAFVAAAPALASGNVSIQQPDGSVDSYNDVAIKLIHGVLYITTVDGKGTLVISKAACAYQGNIMVCLPTAVTLVQAGETKPLDLTTGTMYINGTDDKQQLSLSSMQLPPHSLLFTFSTKRGTYVNLSGTIDKVNK